MNAIILAAGRGSRMGELTANSPKCLLNFAGRPLIEWQIDALMKAGIKKITIVAGYKSDQLARFADSFIFNKHWDSSNMVSSLLCAKKTLEHEETIVSYADIVYSAKVVSPLVGSMSNIAILSNQDWKLLWEARFDHPLEDVECFKASKDGKLTQIGGHPKHLDEVGGQFMGLLKFTPQGWLQIDRYLETVPATSTNSMDMTTLLSNLLLEGVTIDTIPVAGEWYEFDSMRDLEVAQRWSRQPNKWPKI